MKKMKLAKAQTVQVEPAKCADALSGHEHIHAGNCGHKSYVHAGHVCYEHDGHFHYMHNGHAHACAGPFSNVKAPGAGTLPQKSGKLLKMEPTKKTKH